MGAIRLQGKSLLLCQVRSCGGSLMRGEGSTLITYENIRMGHVMRFFNEVNFGIGYIHDLIGLWGLRKGRRGRKSMMRSD